MRTRIILVAFCALTLETSTAVCQNRSGSGTLLSPNQTEELLHKAQQSYYNLQANGLRDFGCEVVADWDSVAAARHTTAEGWQNAAKLKKVRFQVELDSTGEPTVSHAGEFVGANADDMQKAQELIAGEEQILHGFLQSWSPFVQGTLFEATGDNQIEDLGNKFQWTQTFGSGTARIVLSHDLLVENMQVDSTDRVNLNPTFSHTKDGFLMTGYQGIVTFPEGNPIRVSMRLTYQDVDGFRLPHVLNASLISGQHPLELPLRFTNCGVNGRYTSLTAQQAPSSRMTFAPTGPQAKSQPAAAPSAPAVFVLSTGERVESRHYLFSADALQLEQQDGNHRSIPLSSINADATMAANRERGIDVHIPQSKNEIMVSF